MNKIAGIIAAIIFIITITAACALAENGEVNVGDFYLLKIRCPAGGFTADQRADAIQARVNQLLADNELDSASVKVEQVGKEAVLYANGRLFVTVHQCDASANGTTPMKLAKTWGDRLIDLYAQAAPKMPGKTSQPHVPV